MKVRHKYRGPKLSTDGRAFSGTCTCGWIGPHRHSRDVAKADHMVHKQREAAELRADIEADRDWTGANAEVE